MDENIKIITIKIKYDLLEKVDQAAKEDNRNRSEEIRHMLQKYLEIRQK